ncbi:Probable Zinc-ribbon domain containing protein [Candidatus Nanopelagicaceae bacterium]
MAIILIAVPNKKEKLPLSITHPELAKQADGWDASKLSAQSHSKVAWKCIYGHTWERVVRDRVKKKKSNEGADCPLCNSLGAKFPELAKEADGWDPTTVAGGSNKKFPWKCLKGHIWEESPNKRTGRGDGCPYCSGNRILVGFNDLATTHPDLAKDAVDWDPRNFSAGSNKKVKWKCPLGHYWEIDVAHRTSKLGTGCPVCANQKIETGFNDLATKFPDISEEADGWDSSKVGASSNKKLPWKCNLGHRWTAQVSSRTLMGTGCPVCVNLKVQEGFNDLATTHPELAKEADGWDPRKVVGGSSEQLQWKCSNGHIYSAPPVRRTGKNTGCAICANKVLLTGFNDIATTHPELAKEANGWDPTTVNAGRGLQKSGKTKQKRKWKCSLGHIWEATPSSRTNSHHQSGCPVCSGNQLLKGFNDLATTHPELAKEAFGWDPEQFVASGSRKLKWKCQEGHSWNQRISERKSGTGCPTCAKSGFDPNSDGYLYFIEHQTWDMYQIGISNIPDQRLSKHKKIGWEIRELRGPMEGHLTQQWETAILRMLKAKGADLSNEKIAGRFDGYSEAWSKATYEVASIGELMRATEEFENE